jgi:hypothetical protein
LCWEAWNFSSSFPHDTHHKPCALLDLIRSHTLRSFLCPQHVMTTTTVLSDSVQTWPIQVASRTPVTEYQHDDKREQRKFITVFTRARHRSLSSASWIQSTLLQPISIRSQPPIYALVFQVVSFLLAFPSKPCTHSSPMRYFCLREKSNSASREQATGTMARLSTKILTSMTPFTKINLSNYADKLLAALTLHVSLKSAVTSFIQRQSPLALLY